MILYLHGFRSSPASFKARLVEKEMQQRGKLHAYQCPQLPISPREATEHILKLVDSVPVEHLAIIGSSLGGFYATWLAEKIGCRAVLLNPAVRSSIELEKYIGPTTAYHSDTPLLFTATHVEELKVLETKEITKPERYFLIAATGDELLDWRQMVSHYAGARQLVVQGSDHALSNFASLIDQVLTFCENGISK